MTIPRPTDRGINKWAQPDEDAVDCSSSGVIEAVFDPKEKIYKQLLMVYGRRQEHLNDISAILIHSRKNNLHNTQTTDLIEHSIDKLRANLNNLTSFLMPHQSASFYIEKGCVLLEQERFEEAIVCWEEVLKVEPHNQVVKAKLLEFISKNTLVADASKRLLYKYRLDYINSFGHGSITVADNIAIVAPKNILYVADQENHKVYKFNRNRQLLGEFSHGVKRPRGIFYGAEELVWICDSGNQRIIGVNSVDQVNEEIFIVDVLGASFSATHPIDGCFSKGSFFLILQDQYGMHHQIVSFDRYARSDSVRTFPLDIVGTPIRIRYFDDELFVGVSDPSYIYVYDSSIDNFKLWGNTRLPGQLRSFVKSGNCLFVTAGEYLLKISKKDLIFAADIRQRTGLKSAVHCSVATFTEGNDTFLILTDVEQACMHTFKI